MILKDKIVHINGYNCWLNYMKYGNGRTAIELVDQEDGGLYAMATVNVTEINVNKDEVLIKNYSENEGILDVLVKEGIVSEPIQIFDVNYIKIPLCKLLMKPKEWKD
jgi:hypothetical protein